jgi:hypothetical protein
VESRKYFVDQVASTILENHAKTNDSFIFGLSGKWGEGKTTFLDDLKEEITKRDSSFKILSVNPWKFVSDKISFLRSFLAQLPEPELSRTDKIKSFFLDPTLIRDLYYDISKEVTDWRIIIGLGFGILCGLMFYCFFWPLIQPFIPPALATVLKITFTAIVIPVGLAIFKNISSYQQGSKTFSTIDRFENFLDLRLRQNQGTNFLIYIDDLDRVTPTVARDVLDNLRTFFEKPQLSFIVAGDHTVLERYVGRELLPGENNVPAQLEEGRRYLKKIFNVYWRLPPPIPSELMQFIEKDLFTPKKDDLDKIFKGSTAAEDLNTFSKLLSRYFEGNFRQIIRFFEMVTFTFQIIEKKRSAVPIQEKSYFEELLQNPLLVIRTLMIQESCTPLFEGMLRDPEVLYELEDAVENQNSAGIQEIIEQYKLSENQTAFIEKFLYEEPRFYKESSLVVSNLQPFLVLAADSSFSDGRGPSPEKFIEIIERGDPEAVRKSILSSGEPKLKEAASSFVTRYNSAPTSTPGERQTLLATIMNALVGIAGSHNSHVLFAEKLKDIDLSALNSLSSSERDVVYVMFWSWLDVVGDKSQNPAFESKFQPVSFDDFSQLHFASPVGKFSSARVGEWFRTLYPTSKLSAYQKLFELKDALDKETLASSIQPLENDMLIDILHNREGARDVAYDLLLCVGRLRTIRDGVLEHIKINRNQEFWGWIKGKQLSTMGLSDQDLQEAAISELDQNPNDFATISNLLNFAAHNNFSDTSKIWDKISKNSIDIFQTNLGHFGGTPYPQIAPNRAQARTLFSAIVTRIRSLDESLQPQSIRWLSKGTWLWQNLDKPKEMKIMEAMAKSPNADISNAAHIVLASWKPNENS